MAPVEQHGEDIKAWVARAADAGKVPLPGNVSFSAPDADGCGAGRIVEELEKDVANIDVDDIGWSCSDECADGCSQHVLVIVGVAWGKEEKAAKLGCGQGGDLGGRARVIATDSSHPAAKFGGADWEGTSMAQVVVFKSREIAAYGGSGEVSGEEVGEEGSNEVTCSRHNGVFLVGGDGEHKKGDPRAVVAAARVRCLSGRSYHGREGGVKLWDGKGCNGGCPGRAFGGFEGRAGGCPAKKFRGRARREGSREEVEKQVRG